jgi:hypothetical protein
MAKSIITDTNIDPVLLKQSKPAFNNYVQKSFIEKYRDRSQLLTEVIARRYADYTDVYERKSLVVGSRFHRQVESFKKA